MTAYDTFARDHLPPRELWPEMDFSGVPELAYPERLNCAAELIDRTAERFGDRPALFFADACWTYAELKDKVDRVARVLSEDLGVIPGNRVLLRGFNNPMMVAAWFAVAKLGGVVVATMPLLRAGELAYIAEKAEIRHCLCQDSLVEEAANAREASKRLERVMTFSSLGEADAELDRAMAARPGGFQAYDGAADDVVLIAFTSGTTGRAKGTMHFHRDMLATCDTFARHVIGVRPDDVFVGSPPLAFTFGLGAHVLFPFRFGAATVLVEKFGPTTLLETVQRYRVTGMYTAPTGYRALAPLAKDYDIASLRLCVSAGEALPKATSDLWFDATGIRIVDGIGSTEMLHIFISAAGDDIRPGSTGKAIPGYQAKLVDRDGDDLAPGETQGWLAVKGPTGCRYLDDPERQRGYVKKGWNVTGDIYRQDEDGYFWFVARGDDMIISAGYNISGPEVENAVLSHPKVAECAVIGAPDEERGQIVKAYVVLRDGEGPSQRLVADIQDHVKRTIAPYKYPRAVEFLDALPKTPTGKLQRFKLREQAKGA